MPMRGVSGHLELAQGCARLTEARKQHVDLLPELHPAVVRRISAKGIRTDGYEVIARRANTKSYVDRYALTWFCLVHTKNLTDFLDMGNMEEVLGNPNSATGF